MLYLLCAILYQLALLGPMTYPVYRLARRWMRTAVLPPADALILAAWAVGAVAVSFLIAFTLWRHSLHTLHK